MERATLTENLCNDRGSLVVGFRILIAEVNDSTCRGLSFPDFQGLTALCLNKLLGKEYIYGIRLA